MKISLSFLCLRWDRGFYDLCPFYSLASTPSILIYSSRLSFASLKRFLKITPTGLFWFPIKNISHIGTCYQGLFSDRLWSWIQERFNKTEGLSEKGSYAVTIVQPKTSHVNKCNITTTNTTTMNCTVPCLLFQFNKHTQIHYDEDIFLKCNIWRQGMSRGSNNTFSPIFINRQIKINCIRNCSNTF